jgi:hypothetical protein
MGSRDLLSSSAADRDTRLREEGEKTSPSEEMASEATEVPALQMVKSSENDDEEPEVGIAGLRGQIWDLLTRFPLDLLPLDMNVDSAFAQAGRSLFQQTSGAPWAFWLSLFSLATAAYEIARREMTRPLGPHVMPPNYSDPTVG